MPSADRLTATWIELAVRLGILGVLLYWAFTLIQPFITIAIWSVVITVALDPAYEKIASSFGGRRRVAAIFLTIVSLAVVIGPAAWLVLGLIESVQTLVQHFNPTELVLPRPPQTIRSWPVVGVAVFDFWELAATSSREAVAKLTPHLRTLGGVVVQVGTEAGSGALKFLAAIVVAGFLFPHAPALASAATAFATRVAAGRGDEFVHLAGTTIRAVARGVIGISALQALLAGLGLFVAGVPGTTLITSAVLVLGIMQIGPSIVLLPVIVWSWFSMEPLPALLFTAYMLPVNLLDNVLRPMLLGRGLPTPIIVILIGVIGGTLSYGITGLFLGPIVLAVIWELVLAWVKADGAR